MPQWPAYPGGGGPGYGPPASPGGPGYGGWPGYGPQGSQRGGGPGKGLWIGLAVGGAAVVAIIVVAALLVAAPGGHAKSSAPATPGGPGGRTLNPAQLEALLPGNGELPSGWTVVPGTRGQLAASAGAPGPRPGTPDTPRAACSELAKSAYGPLLLLMQDYEASAAMEIAGIASEDDNGPEIDLGGYLPGDAQKQLSEVKSYLARCPHFTGQAVGTSSANVTAPFTASLDPVSVSGADQAFVVQVQAHSSAVGYNDEYTLLARFGNTIVGMSDTAFGSSQASEFRSFASLAATVGQHTRSEAG